MNNNTQKRKLTSLVTSFAHSVNKRKEENKSLVTKLKYGIPFLTALTISFNTQMGALFDDYDKEINVISKAEASVNYVPIIKPENVIVNNPSININTNTQTNKFDIQIPDQKDIPKIRIGDYSLSFDNYKDYKDEFDNIKTFYKKNNTYNGTKLPIELLDALYLAKKIYTTDENKPFDPMLLVKTMKPESNFDIKANNPLSTAIGMAQMITNTSLWRLHGLKGTSLEKLFPEAQYVKKQILTKTNGSKYEHYYISGHPDNLSRDQVAANLHKDYTKSVILLAENYYGDYLSLKRSMPSTKATSLTQHIAHVFGAGGATKIYKSNKANPNSLAYKIFNERKAPELENIILNAYNSSTNEDHRLKTLKESLKKYPILIDSKGIAVSTKSFLYSEGKPREIAEIGLDLIGARIFNDPVILSNIPIFFENNDISKPRSTSGILKYFRNEGLDDTPVNLPNHKTYSNFMPTINNDETNSLHAKRDDIIKVALMNKQPKM